jgi:hypothetical protein
MKRTLLKVGRLGLLAMLLFSGLSLVAQEIAGPNFGFEAGDASEWQYSPTASGSLVIDDFGQSQGIYSAELFNNFPSSGAVLKKANLGIGVVNPGDEITITFDARGFGSNGGVAFAEFLSELDGGGTSSSVILGGVPLPVTGQWAPFSFTVTAGPDVSGGVTVQFVAVTGGDPNSSMELYVDNLSVVVQEAQEPTTVSVEFCADFECVSEGVADFNGQIVFDTPQGLQFNNMTPTGDGSTVYCGTYDLEVGPRLVTSSASKVPRVLSEWRISPVWIVPVRVDAPTPPRRLPPKIRPLPGEAVRRRPIALPLRVLT